MGAKGEVARVGVTGHRFLADVHRIEVAVADALDRAQPAFPDAHLVCVNSLADGADQLTAELALAHGGKLVVVLPLPADDYRRDFVSRASRHLLRGRGIA